ncbi:MAG: carboxylesterase family protein [Acidimicrobiales bacterium]|nr:carboxylesterase family protein [Acidimicrobiales bacterium]
MRKIGASSRAEAVTTGGRVRGKFEDEGSMAVFLGIPYAAPPTGSLRWRPPRPVEGWKRTKKCTKLGPFAFQRKVAFDVFFQGLINGIGLGKARQNALTAAVKLAPLKESEDCLTVNVRAPAYASDLPVMVWIHGGDHTDGSGGEPHYQSNSLPQRGCVLVTLNYRLGLFGFMAHRELAEESPDGVSGNYGLLDQIAALQWVQENIANFGGDPNRVTIFGESAGGEAVLNLMTSPRARGLFHRAIAQSPSDSGRWLHLRRPALDFIPAEDAGQRFATKLAGEAPGQIDRLRAMDAETLADAYREDFESGRYMFPVVDGAILPSMPMSAFSDGQQAAVPLMIGYNSDEGTLINDLMNPAGAEFAPPPLPGMEASVTSPRPTPQALRSTLERSYPSPTHVDRLLAAYPGLGSLDQKAVIDHVGDHMFGVHVDQASRRHAELGNPVYRYHFRSVPASKNQTIGAFHAAELFYVFDTSFPMIPQPKDAHLLKRNMGDRWFAFAATGTPDSPGREPWPLFHPANPQHMVFDRPTSSVQPCPPQPGLDLMRERIDWLTDQLRSDSNWNSAV